VKIHRPLAEAATAILHGVFDEGKIADHTLRAAFRSNPRWGSRDRHFVASSVFDCIRWRRRLGYLCDSENPASLLACHWQLGGYTQPEWPDFPWPAPAVIRQRLESLPSRPRAIRESYPDWIDRTAASQLGEDQWQEEAKALNEPAPIVLRCNPLRMPLPKLINALAARQIRVQPLPEHPLALIVAEGQRIPADLTRQGWFEIQDAHSQQVSPFLQIAPGMRVMDACAGAGGKTLHLGALMNGEGELFAYDANPRRLAPLSERAKKAGIGNLKILAPDDGVIEKLRGTIDRLLLDVPCSGLGTLRRQPDIKWRLDADRLDQLQSTQADILRTFSPLVRPGGALVYATCSLLPCENEQQTTNFVSTHPGFILEEQQTLTPATGGHDGFHMARIRRIS